MTISIASVRIQTHAKYEDLIARAKQVAPAATVVVHPCDETSSRRPSRLRLCARWRNAARSPAGCCSTI